MVWLMLPELFWPSSFAEKVEGSTSGVVIVFENILKTSGVVIYWKMWNKNVWLFSQNILGIFNDISLYDVFNTNQNYLGDT
jgi:hypothetical protein